MEVKTWTMSLLILSYWWKGSPFHLKNRSYITRALSLHTFNWFRQSMKNKVFTDGFIQKLPWAHLRIRLTHESVATESQWLHISSSERWCFGLGVYLEDTPSESQGVREKGSWRRWPSTSDTRTWLSLEKQKTCPLPGPIDQWRLQLTSGQDKQQVAQQPASLTTANRLQASRLNSHRQRSRHPQQMKATDEDNRWGQGKQMKDSWEWKIWATW